MKLMERLVTSKTETPCGVCGGSGKIVAETTGDEVQCSWCGGTGKAGTDPRDLFIPVAREDFECPCGKSTCSCSGDCTCSQGCTCNSCS